MQRQLSQTQQTHVSRLAWSSHKRRRFRAWGGHVHFFVNARLEESTCQFGGMKRLACPMGLTKSMPKAWGFSPGPALLDRRICLPVCLFTCLCVLVHGLFWTPQPRKTGLAGGSEWVFMETPWKQAKPNPVEPSPARAIPAALCVVLFSLPGTAGWMSLRERSKQMSRLVVAGEERALRGHLHSPTRLIDFQAGYVAPLLSQSSCNEAPKDEGYE